jgi:poly-gamma-glutamate synthesis protein (capsule biosynthesis protein)
MKATTISSQSLLFCGDTFLQTRDNSDPFSLISGFLKRYSCCINLEASLGGSTNKNKTICICIAENLLDFLPPSIQTISLLNNHASDGGDALKMPEALRLRNKSVLGPQNPDSNIVIIDKIRVELISAYLSLPRMRISYKGQIYNKLLNAVAGSEADRKIAFLHWGYEHTSAPAPYQREMACRLADAGADLIVGHHPHVAQGHERYRDTMIYYSLGNFNFAQLDGSASLHNKWGYAVSYRPDTNEAEVIPYKINNNYQPYIPPYNEQAELKTKIADLCQKLRMSEGDWYINEYRIWYIYEIIAWKRDFAERFSSKLLLRFAAWLLLPAQLRFYIIYIIHSIQGRFRYNSNVK